jgi:hypothetical protein
MARIRTSALISSIDGKLNGSVFQRTQGGLTIRNGNSRVNSNTPRSNLRKIGMIQVQSDWQQLSNSQRLLWNTYATYLNKKQKHNSSLTLNGHQLFININSIRFDLSPDNVLFQPYLLSSPVLNPLPQPIAAVSVEVDGVALFVNLDRGVSNVTEVVVCFLSRPLLPSQMSSNVKMVLMKSPTNSGTEFQCNVAYEDVYGRNLIAGEWVQVKVAVYSTVSQNYSNYTVQRLQVI